MKKALVISVSGGKDSQAMTSHLIKEHVHHYQEVFAVHADLGSAEWAITHSFLQSIIPGSIPLHIVKHHKNDSLIEGMFQRHQQRKDAAPFPDSARRWCTSDYKRSPISKWIRNTFPQNYEVHVAMGMRGEESPRRNTLPVWSERKDTCAATKNRIVYDWLPIHTWTEQDVWNEIFQHQAGVKSLYKAQAQVNTFRKSNRDIDAAIAYIRNELCFPAHPAYAIGNNRLSCALCVLATTSDLRNGAQFNQETYQKLVDLEIESGYSFKQNQWLMDVEPNLLRDDQKEWRETKRQQPQLL